MGHRTVLTLREGETMVRSCANSGNKHINRLLGGGKPGCLNRVAGQGPLRYLNRAMPDAEFKGQYYFHKDYRGGIVGNGELTYKPDLAGGGYRGGIESEANIASTSDDGKSPALHLAGASSGLGASTSINGISTSRNRRVSSGSVIWPSRT